MVHELLLTGEENAIPGREICGLLGITLRELTAAVEKERRAGKPICAASGRHPGYFLPANRAEMERYCGRLLHRAGELHKTRRACLAAMNSLPGEEGNSAGNSGGTGAKKKRGKSRKDEAKIK